MTFSHPELLLLLIVPALMLWAVPRRGWGLVVPFDHGKHRPTRWLGAVLGVFDAMPALLLGAALLLLAGPQMLKQPKNARELADIQFALDVSGSMSSENRYEMATDAIEKFITQREGDAFGLTMFGSRQIRWMPLTKDMDAIRNSLPFANPENQPLHMSGTLIGAALRFCKDNMLAESTGGDRMIILVSDGQSADIDGDEGADIAQELADEKISVYHVHVARDDVPQEVIDLAEATGGEAFQAADPESLSKVFRHIDRMRPAKFNPAGTVPMDHFRPFALAGVALLALHVAGLMGLRYTPW